MKYLIICSLSVLIFIGCNQVDSENTQQEQDLPQEVEPEEIPEKDFSEIGFQLMETETIGDLKVGLTVEEVEKIIGKAEEVTPFEYWGADGFEHQARVYQNETIELDFVKLDDRRIVSNMITIAEGCELKTSRDIGIGSSYEDVYQAYKNEISTPDNPSTLIAGTIYGGIIFQFSDADVVNNIFIGAAAE